MVNTEAQTCGVSLVAGFMLGALATSSMADPASDLLKLAAAAADPWPWLMLCDPNKSVSVDLFRPSSVAVDENMPLVFRLCGMI